MLHLTAVIPLLIFSMSFQCVFQEAEGLGLDRSKRWVTSEEGQRLTRSKRGYSIHREVNEQRERPQVMVNDPIFDKQWYLVSSFSIFYNQQ